MTQISKDLLRAFRADVDKALAPIAAKHGLELKLGKIGYSDTAFTAKIEANIPGQTREAERLRKHAELFGAKAEWLGQWFRQGRTLVQVTGISASGCLTVIDEAGRALRYKGAITPRWDKVAQPVDFAPTVQS